MNLPREGDGGLGAGLGPVRNPAVTRPRFEATSLRRGNTTCAMPHPRNSKPRGTPKKEKRVEKRTRRFDLKCLGNSTFASTKL